MSMKEIEKLREKVEKDPNSKLYVPLAEEYRKAGMLDEAVEVLQKAIAKQPGYMSARVSLGKIYVEKGQLNEARVEFEQVVKLIPDNLYAHKKLAEIYRDSGERELAIKAFRTFLKLNPMDAEALNSLRDLERTYIEQSLEKPKEPVISVAKEAGVADEPVSEAMSLEHTFHEQKSVGATELGEDLHAFKESLFGVDAGSDAENPEELLADEDDIAVVEEIPEEADKEWSFDETVSTPEIETFQEGVATGEEIPEDADEEWSFGGMADVLNTDFSEAAEKTEETPDDLFRQEDASENAFPLPQDNSELLQTADKLIAEGKYIGAMETYRRVLSDNPDDKKVLQRIEELRSLLKMMGKDKDVLVSKLNAFLSAIHKRGDEFHRSS